MKYTNLKVAIPYEDGTEPMVLVITFTGTVDFRRVKREIRKYCKRAFNRTVTLDFIRYECKYFITLPEDKEVTEKRMVERRKAFDLWLQEQHEQTERDTEDQSGTIGKTTVGVSTV